jgi:hypothetical protein
MVLYANTDGGITLVIKIALDVDGCLCDSVKLSSIKLNQDNPECPILASGWDAVDWHDWYGGKPLLTKEKFHEVMDEILHPSNIPFLEPFPGTEKALALLSKVAMGCEVYFVTMRPYVDGHSPQSYTARWISNAGYIPHPAVVCTSDKAGFAATVGITHFYEDCPKVLYKLINVPNMKLFRPDATYNKDCPGEVAVTALEFVHAALAGVS